MRVFVFRITEACNKRCEVCCCGLSSRMMDPDRFAGRISQIGALFPLSPNSPVICLTGGEPFIYRARNAEGLVLDVADLAALVARNGCASRLIVKTSGWRPHRVLDQRLIAVLSVGKQIALDVRLGFNLFQNNGEGAVVRLAHMCRSLLASQDVVRVEVIYDRLNFAATFRAIEVVLQELGVADASGMCAAVEDKCTHHRFSIPISLSAANVATLSGATGAERALLVDTMPAYAGTGSPVTSRFFEAALGAPCPRIESGPDDIMYNPDFSFRQCNDAFAEYRGGPFPSRPGGLAADVAFLGVQFSRLKTAVDGNREAFQSRRSQCLFCSHLMQRSAHQDTRPVLRRNSIRGECTAADTSYGMMSACSRSSRSPVS